MKVILLEDVKGIGKKGQLIEAAEGHARNFLLPRKLAVEANKSNLNKMDQKKKSEEHKRQKELEEAQALRQALSDKTINVMVKIGENGKLFGSVTNKEIVAALRSQTGIELDKKKIILSEPIKSKGEKQIEVKLHPKVVAKLNINITEG